MTEMSPIDYIKLALSRYTDFSGRSRRMEYWMFFAGTMGAAVIASILDMMVGFPLFYSIVALGTVIPSLACGVRRLHDQDKSGWFMLLALIPLVGLVLLYFMFVEGTKGDNQYGPDPKAGIV